MENKKDVYAELRPLIDEAQNQMALSISQEFKVLQEKAQSIGFEVIFEELILRKHGKSVDEHVLTLNLYCATIKNDDARTLSHD